MLVGMCPDDYKKNQFNPDVNYQQLRKYWEKYFSTRNSDDFYELIL